MIMCLYVSCLKCKAQMYFKKISSKIPEDGAPIAYPSF